MAANEIYLHSCWYGSFSVTVPMGCSLVVEWGDGGVERRVSWRGLEFFSRNYPHDDFIYGDHTVYCTHVYAEDDAPILEFNSGCLWGSDPEVNERVDTSHCPSLLALWCTVLEPPDLSGNPLLKELYCDNSRFEMLDVSHNPMLETLSCYSCRKLTKLNLSRNAALRKLDIAFAGVKKLGLGNRSALQWVNYEYSHLDAKSEEYLLRIIRQNGGRAIKDWKDREKEEE